MDDDFIAWLKSIPDPEWMHEEVEVPGAMVRGRGGKPTGERLPSGKEAMAMMDKLNGGTKMTRAKPLKREKIKTTGPDQDLVRQQQASAKAILAPLDAVAHAMESKWGCGRLETLVSAELAARFHSAHVKLNLAIASLDLVALAEKAEVMRRGWVKLDEEATAAGHQPWRHPDLWEVRSPGGRVYRIARTAIDEKNAPPLDGACLLTLDEVARIIEAWDADGAVTELRAQFPGSEIVTAGRPLQWPGAQARKGHIPSPVIDEFDRPDVGIETSNSSGLAV